jgi:hypothetical protein
VARRERRARLLGRVGGLGVAREDTGNAAHAAQSALGGALEREQKARLALGGSA